MFTEELWLGGGNKTVSTIDLMIKKRYPKTSRELDKLMIMCSSLVKRYLKYPSHAFFVGVTVLEKSY